MSMPICRQSPCIVPRRTSPTRNAPGIGAIRIVAWLLVLSAAACRAPELTPEHDLASAWAPVGGWPSGLALASDYNLQQFVSPEEGYSWSSVEEQCSLALDISESKRRRVSPPQLARIGNALSQCLWGRGVLFPASTRRRFAAALVNFAAGGEAIGLPAHQTAGWRALAALTASRYQDSLVELDKAHFSEGTPEENSLLTVRFYSLLGMEHGKDALEVLQKMSRLPNAPGSTQLWCRITEVALASLEDLRSRKLSGCSTASLENGTPGIDESSIATLAVVNQRLDEALRFDESSDLYLGFGSQDSEKIYQLAGLLQTAFALRAQAEVLDQLEVIGDDLDKRKCKVLVEWLAGAYSLATYGVAPLRDMGTVAEKASACTAGSDRRFELESLEAATAIREGDADKAVGILRLMLEEWPEDWRGELVRADLVSALRAAGREAEAETEEQPLIARNRQAAGLSPEIPRTLR